MHGLTLFERSISDLISVAMIQNPHEANSLNKPATSESGP
jgi:hypothetical protein